MVCSRLFRERYVNINVNEIETYLCLIPKLDAQLVEKYKPYIFSLQDYYSSTLKTFLILSQITNRLLWWKDKFWMLR